MSASITRSAAGRQLAAIGCESFDIGVLQHSGRMLLRERSSAEHVVSALKWLRKENTRGAQIFVRPHGEEALGLLDDLTSSAIAELKHSRFDPAVDRRDFAKEFSGLAESWKGSELRVEHPSRKDLARRFGGDPSSANWRHFGG